MSSSKRCGCRKIPPKERRKAWRVVKRNCSHSAFNGYRHARSDYSTVFCVTCQRCWRAKYPFMDSLPDANRDIEDPTPCAKIDP